MNELHEDQHLGSAIGGCFVAALAFLAFCAVVGLGIKVILTIV